jgi:hypothetical protein
LTTDAGETEDAGGQKVHPQPFRDRHGDRHGAKPNRASAAGQARALTREG